MSTPATKRLIKKLAIGLGIAALALAAAVFATRFQRDELAIRLWALRKQIKTGWIGHPALVHLKMMSEQTLFIPKCHNIQFYVKIIASDKFTKKKGNDSQLDVSVTDPFAPENYKDIFIDSLSDTHALLYNKFHLVPYHVLIVTKQFVHQNTMLNEADFEASLTVMKALEGFVFFNSGREAGASQDHKHLQAIPYSSFPNQYIPIGALIEKRMTEEKAPVTYFMLPEFQFKHVFYMFNPTVTKGLNDGTLKEKVKFLEAAYRGCLSKLGNEDLKIAYNMVLTKHWMFLVLRKTESTPDMIKINAVAFTGSFAVRSDEEYKHILNHDPFNILTQVSYPL
ncbi:MAG: DUF4922 domain-containing protein [Candidatus Pacebacteria bacterium]|nr:DUF4922 domain-containing protein [Candidatus Paceibacterota bacterium]